MTFKEAQRFLAERSAKLEIEQMELQNELLKLQISELKRRGHLAEGQPFTGTIKSVCDPQMEYGFENGLLVCLSQIRPGQYTR